MSNVGQANTFNGKAGGQVRFDDRSNKEARVQYRLRFYPSISINQNWSAHAFATTGNDFSSSHNTINASTSDNFHLRRLFVRYTQGKHKTEFGVLPTYKGKVSSTGLSKDGWIQGARQVIDINSNQVEIVVGHLSDTRSSHALHLIKDVNFVELEFSSKDYGRLSYELGLERLLDANYSRGEIRYKYSDKMHYAMEIIGKLNSRDFKYLASMNTQGELIGRPAELFVYYTYVDEGFGQRAELTEDFLSLGHGFAAEIESSFGFNPDLDWFAKFEMYESNSRIQFGMKYNLTW